MILTNEIFEPKEWSVEKQSRRSAVRQFPGHPSAANMQEQNEGTRFFFEEINPYGIFCKGSHPFSTVERFGHWYYCRGQDKEAGIHSSGMEWRLFTKDRDLAVKTAKSHIE